MMPTLGLRFVEREFSVERPDLGEGIAESHKRMILQQKFVITGEDADGKAIQTYEWRDVPVEKEENEIYRIDPDFDILNFSGGSCQRGTCMGASGVQAGLHQYGQFL